MRFKPVCPQHMREAYKVDDYHYVCPDERHNFLSSPTYLGQDKEKKHGFILSGA